MDISIHVTRSRQADDRETLIVTDRRGNQPLRGVLRRLLFKPVDASYWLAIPNKTKAASVLRKLKKAGMTVTTWQFFAAEWEAAFGSDVPVNMAATAGG